MEFHLLRNLDEATIFNMIVMMDLRDLENLIKSGEDTRLSELVKSKYYLESLSDYYVIPVPKDIKEAMVFIALSYDKRLEVAAERGDINLIKKLISLGATRYNDAAFKSALKGNVEVVKFFLDEDLDVDIEELAVAAARSNSVGVMSLLVSKGLKDLTSALIESIAYNSVDVVKYMVGLEIDDYSTPMNFAVQMGSPETIKILLDTGKINPTDYINTAKFYGKERIAKLLEEYK